LQAVANGDEIAFRMLYDQHRDRIYSIARKLLDAPTEAKDALQEIFIRIWLHREKLRDVQQFSSYINTITRNHLLNLLRKQVNGKAMVAEMTIRSEAPEQVDPMETRELREAIYGAVNQLPPQQKKVFELSRMEGLRLEEIAEHMQISRETVKKHLAQANFNLRTSLKANASVLFIILFPHL
jgi:RNA polymerase sigma-70 factor (family 1)